MQGLGEEEAGRVCEWARGFFGCWRCFGTRPRRWSHSAVDVLMPLGGTLKRLILRYTDLIPSNKRNPNHLPKQRSSPPAFSGHSAPFPHPGQTPDLPPEARGNPGWEVGNPGARASSTPGCVPAQVPGAPGSAERCFPRSLGAPAAHAVAEN